jgi:hypothetical protein
VAGDLETDQGRALPTEQREGRFRPLAV